MNDHTQIQDRLFAYLDFELEEPERAEVERHLASCSACAQELEVTRRANDMFKTVEPQPLPDGFMARLQARLDAPADGMGVPLNRPAASLNGARPLGDSGAVPNVVLPFVPPPSPLPRTELAPPPPEIRALSSQARPTSRAGAMRWVGALAAVLVVALGIGVLTRPQAPNPALAAAALAYSEGNIEMVRGGTTSTVTTTMALSPGDILQTAAESKAVVTLGNNASVRLAENTRMHVLALETHANNGRLEAKLELQSGSIWVEEAGGVRCALQAGGSLIVPIGTTYQATLDGSNPLVQVWEGSVDVKSLTAGLNLPATSLIAGEQALLAPTGIDRAYIKQQVLKTNAFVSWNLRLENLQHPRATTALTRPALMQSIQVPRFFSNPQHGAAPAPTVAVVPPPAQTAPSVTNTGGEPPSRAGEGSNGDDGHAREDVPQRAPAEAAPGAEGAQKSATEGHPSAPVQAQTNNASAAPRVTYQNGGAVPRVTYQNGHPNPHGSESRPRVQPTATPHPHATEHPHHPHPAATIDVPATGSYAPTVTVEHTPSPRPSDDANRPQAAETAQWSHRPQGNGGLQQTATYRPNTQWNRPGAQWERPNARWNRPNTQWNRPAETQTGTPHQTSGSAGQSQGPYTPRPTASPTSGQHGATPSAPHRRHSN